MPPGTYPLNTVSAVGMPVTTQGIYDECVCVCAFMLLLQKLHKPHSRTLPALPNCIVAYNEQHCTCHDTLLSITCPLVCRCLYSREFAG